MSNVHDIRENEQEDMYINMIPNDDNESSQ